MIKIKNPAGCLLAAFAILLIALLLAVMPGCSTQKHLNKARTNVDSLVINKQNAMIQELTAEIEHYKSRISEMENLGVTFVTADCPQLNIDSLKEMLMSSGCKQATVDSAIAAYNTVSKKYSDARSTIKKLADGSLIIKGNISELKQSKQRLEEIISEKAKEIFLLKEVNKELNVKLSKKEEVKVKDKKSSFFGSGFWLGVIIGSALTIFVLYKVNKWAIKHER